jgi:L-lactate dehydrogenase complex protein LldG
MAEPITRRQFVERIRKALGRSGEAADVPTPPAVDDAVARLPQPQEDLPGRFAEHAQAIGMDVRQCESKDLIETVRQVLRDFEAHKVVTAVGSLAAAAGLNEALRRAKMEVLAWRDDPTMAEHYTADAGITDVHGALADSGSIICHADAGHGRGLSLVPPTHIALVRESDICADLLDYLRRIGHSGDTRASSSRVIITGPSKTADIEGVLVTGVHGPQRLVVILVRDG